MYELIDGVLVEKTVGFKEAYLASWLVQLLGPYARRHDLGVVLGADGTVQLFPDQVRIPDVAFYAWAKLPGRAIPEDPIPEVVPDLAVEVISRSNRPGEMRAKLGDYFGAGVRAVWYVDPKSESVEVYTAADRVTTLTTADTLDGGEVLPGFAVPVADVFAGPGERPAKASGRQGGGRRRRAADKASGRREPAVFDRRAKEMRFLEPGPIPPGWSV